MPTCRPAPTSARSASEGFFGPPPFLSPPSADRLDVVRRPAAPARLRCAGARPTRRAIRCCADAAVECAAADAHLGPATSAMARAGAQLRRRPAAVHPRGRGRSVLRFRPSRPIATAIIIVLPRGTMWRLAPASAHGGAADRGDQRLLQAAGRGMLGPARDLRSGRARHAEASTRRSARSRTSANGKCRSRGAAQLIDRHLSVQSARCRGLEGRSRPVQAQLARHPPGDEPPLSHCRRRCTRPSWPTVSSSAPSCRGRSRAIPARCKVPFFHSNDDFDEVIFYHQGEFFSRDNIHPGMMTFHPTGFTHGPHPKAFAAGAKAAKTMTDEVAVMIDARDPLDMSAGGRSDRRPQLRRQLEARNETRLAAAMAATASLSSSTPRSVALRGRAAYRADAADARWTIGRSWRRA